MINYGYFRHRFDAHENPKLNKFVDEIGVVGFAYYFTLLELYGAKISNSNEKNSAEIHIRTIANVWRKRIDCCHNILLKMQQSDILVITNLQLSSNLVATKAIPTYNISINNFLKYYGSYKKTNSVNVSNKIKENKSKVYDTNIKTFTPSVDDIFQMWNELLTPHGFKFATIPPYGKEVLTEIEAISNFLNSKNLTWKNYFEEIVNCEKLKNKNLNYFLDGKRFSNIMNGGFNSEVEIDSIFGR